MSKTIYHNYRTLTKEQIIGLNCRYHSPEGSYGKQRETVGLFDLEAVGDSQENEYSIENTDAWDSEVYDCSICQHLLLNSAVLSSLFHGPESLVTKDSTLGIAALWQIDKTWIRGCIDTGCMISAATLKRSTADTEVIYSQTFPAGVLAGTLKVRFMLYLKEPGLRTAFGKAAHAGTLLGELVNPLIIHIDGDAPDFPVMTANASGRELWWLEVGSDINPCTDPFVEENVAIVLNEAHRDYTKLKNGKQYDTPLFNEVLASALEHIFWYFYQGQFKDEMVREDDFQEGSIAMALKYMKDCFGIITDTPENLHKTIRKMIQNPAGTGVA